MRASLMGVDLMISAHLPSGTKIECIAKRLTSGSQLRIGCVYTVRGYMQYPNTTNFGVITEEVRNIQLGIEWGYWLGIFRVVQLPKLPASILECLNVDAPREVERV
jgi:hypothetical protein